MKLTHLRLLVDDFPACFRFYRDMMGFTPTWGEEDEGCTDFDTGGRSTLAVMNRGGQAEVVSLRDAGDSAMPIFGLDDLDTVLADLRGRGAAPGPVTERHDSGVRFTHFRVPAGNLIEVNEPIPMVEE